MSALTAAALLLSAALQAAPPAGAAAPVTGSRAGLDMVPAQCRNGDQQTTPTDDILVFRNKLVSFAMGAVTLHSEVRGTAVRVRYSDEGGEAIFEVPGLIRYRARDVRLYHGILAGRPIVIWEEVVENFEGRAGIMEYRGRGLFPVCDGRIRVVDHSPYLPRQ